jgi:hypothetical protein
MAYDAFSYTAANDQIINTHWLAVYVRSNSSVANCYISGTGVANFSVDPDWVDLPLQQGQFHLQFEAVLEPDDLLMDCVASVGIDRMDFDDPGLTWVFGLDAVEVRQTTTDLEIVVSGGYREDVWIEQMSFKIGLLVYRPRFNTKPTAQRLPIDLHDFLQKNRYLSLRENVKIRPGISGRGIKL